MLKVNIDLYLDLPLRSIQLASLQCHMILQILFKYTDLLLKKHLLLSMLKTVQCFCGNRDTLPFNS